MCTSINYKTKHMYFGRTLDYDISYHEQICIVPRKYPFHFRHRDTIETHYAIIGMACVMDGYPLFMDGCNEKGLAIAGLNFVGNAYYSKVTKEKENICQFELIPYILSFCKNVAEVKARVRKIAIVDTPYSKRLPVASLHYLISDGKDAITVEPTKEGIMIYDNPIGVLTNNPPFPFQMSNLNNYMGLSNQNPKNTFLSQIELHSISRGMGALGLPGDLSSPSRFVRASFVKWNSIAKDDEHSSVNQFFHILNSVEQQRGCCMVEDQFEITIYTSCMNLNKGIYYYTTYGNHQITAISLFEENLDTDKLILYKLIKEEQIQQYNFK